MWEAVLIEWFEAKVWSILNCLLCRHIYLHKVKYQRRLKCSEWMESLNKLVKINDTSTQHTFWAECSCSTEDSGRQIRSKRHRENGTWRNLPIWASTRFPSRSREPLSFGDMQTQYVFVWEHSCSVHFDRTENREFLQCHLNSTVSKWTYQLLSFVQTLLLYVLQTCVGKDAIAFSLSKKNLWKMST